MFGFSDFFRSLKALVEQIHRATKLFEVLNTELEARLEVGYEIDSIYTTAHVIDSPQPTAVQKAKKK